MLWTALYNKIGRQPIKKTNKHHVYALLENPKTHQMEPIWLELKFDNQGNPYFVKSRHETLPRRRRP